MRRRGIPGAIVKMPPLRAGQGTENRKGRRPLANFRRRNAPGRVFVFPSRLGRRQWCRSEFQWWIHECRRTSSVTLTIVDRSQGAGSGSGGSCRPHWSGPASEKLESRMVGSVNAKTWSLGMTWSLTECPSKSGSHHASLNR